jgi:uncharacterized damage-inducible protein DinB
MAERVLVELLYGKGAHANPIACVEDVSFELAGRTIEGYPNSIWQIVAHMNYWTEYELKRIRGERPVYPDHAAESWPAETKPASDDVWKKEMQRFGDLLGELARLGESNPDILAREVDATHPGHAKYSASLGAVLWQTLVHNSYHVGQIALLRRALG